MRKRVLKMMLVLVLVFVSSMPMLGCNPTFTEEEHLQRITERLQRRYFNEDGTPTDAAVFSRQNEDLIYVDITLERFEVELVSAFDGVREYFLVQFFPVEIGYLSGMILGGEYRIAGIRAGYNPFVEFGADVTNRYASFGTSPPVIRFFMRNEDGVMMCLHFLSLAQDYCCHFVDCDHCPYFNHCGLYFYCDNCCHFDAYCSHYHLVFLSQESIDRGLDFTRARRTRRRTIIYSNSLEIGHGAQHLF